jgi:hypothetical protein
MRNNLLQITLLLSIFLLFSGAHQGRFRIQEFEPAYPKSPPFLMGESPWVDSVLEKLSLEEQIGQMIMIWAYSNKGPEHERAVLRQITRYKVGGILFFQGEPVEQARLTNRFQEESEIPLIIAIDGENGLGMRLGHTLTYPSMMTLGAISDPHLIYRMGNDIAEQCRRLGVQMNFCPVADINNNPSNPVKRWWPIWEECRTGDCWSPPSISRGMVIQARIRTVPFQSYPTPWSGSIPWNYFPSVKRLNRV